MGQTATPSFTNGLTKQACMSSLVMSFMYVCIVQSSDRDYGEYMNL